MESCTTFNDPIHSTIEMHPLCLKLVDTFEFQRLRNIKQCGICHLVYPSAVHTRFEHSIGVYHLAGLFLDEIKKKVTISPEEDLCVRIAALLHDIGHGPFSHLWERFVEEQTGEKWEHEQMSLNIFDRLIVIPEIIKEFEKFKLNEDHQNLIRNIISGNFDSDKNDKLFLLEIVANKKTNIDVDRCDYLKRDAYFFGVTCTLELNRIISYMAVKKDENNQHRIAFRDKLSDNILEMFNCRMKLHKFCYQHRVCKNLEIMLMDALKAADEHYFKNKSMNLSTCHKNLSSFISISDCIFENILHSTDKELEEARAILKRIIIRDLYDYIGTLQLKKTVPLKQLIEIENLLYSDHGTALRLGIINIDMGIEGDYPLKSVLFYTKEGELLNPSDCFNDTYQREIKLLVFSTTKLKDDNLKVEEVMSKLKEKFREYK